MKRSARSIFAGLAGLIFVSIPTAWLLPWGLELCLTPVKGETPLLVYPMRPHERFTLHYFHSVNHKPIWEVHSVDEEGCIYMEEERFVSFNAGMGHWQGHGRLTLRGPYQVIEGIHERLGRFVLRVGSPGVDHTILWRGLRTNLSRLAAGQALTVEAERVSLLEHLRHRLFSNVMTSTP
jgi:hypothetical protein